jgi:predicted nucleotidyltransferase
MAIDKQVRAIKLPKSKFVECIEVNNPEIEYLIECLKKYHPEKVILFGSYARGDYNEASDIDMLIIKDTDRKFFKRIDEVMDLCEDSTKIEPLVYTPREIEEMVRNENDFICTVIKEGVVVFEQ